MKAVVVALVALAGCTTHGVIGTLPTVPTDAAEIVVIRPSGFVGCGSALPITVDGRDAYGIACGEHVIMNVSAGERIVGVKTRRWIVEDENTTAVTAAPHGRYYLRVVSGLGEPALNRVTEQVGRQLMAKTTQIKQ